MPKYRVTTTALRLRSGPGLNFEIIGMLYRNNLVNGGDIKGDWVEVTTVDNEMGWSHRAYLELQDEPIPVSDGDIYRVDAFKLNLRQGPGTTYTVVGSLAKSEMVKGLALSSDNQWAQVERSNGTRGWASLKYMTKLAVPPPASSDDLYLIVKTDVLNVRSGPSTGYSIIGKVNRGDQVVYINASPDWKWVNVRTADNKIGWCYSKYLTEQSDFFALPEEYTATGFHRALTESLFLRQGPGEDHSTVAEIRFNQVLIVDKISDDGKWKFCTNAWGESGWYPVERLSPLGEVALQKESEKYPWLPTAFAEFGNREIPGPQHNPRIVEYLNSTDLALKYPSLPDETDWCAAFVNWCIEKAGIASANSALVNPWTKWGKQSSPPERGAVTTFLWDDGWAHVSFYLGDIGNYVVCLGGNQSDSVWISVYHKKYVTSYRVH